MGSERSFAHARKNAALCRLPHHGLVRLQAVPTPTRQARPSRPAGRHLLEGMIQSGWRSLPLGQNRSPN